LYVSPWVIRASVWHLYGCHEIEFPEAVSLLYTYKELVSILKAKAVESGAGGPSVPECRQGV
jgi:hypothetical protein